MSNQFTTQWLEDKLAKKFPKVAIPEVRFPSKPESELHNEIISTCKNCGWIYFHGSMAHKAMRTVGEPDFTILASRGRKFLIECKTATGKLTPEQLGLKMWAEKLGHQIHTVRSMAEFFNIVDGENGENTPLQ